MIVSERVTENKDLYNFSGKKVLLLFEDNILGRMLGHLFRFTRFKTEERVCRGSFQFIKDDQDKWDVALIDLAHPSMMNKLCFSCMEKRARDFPKVILSSLPLKPEGCMGRSNQNCIVIEKPFKTKELVSKVDSLTKMSLEKIRRRIYQYYN